MISIIFININVLIGGGFIKLVISFKINLIINQFNGSTPV